MSEFERREYPVCVVAGDTWLDQIEFLDDDDNPIDLTGRTPKIQIRTSAAATGAAALELTDGSGLTFTAASGLIEVSAAITLDPGEYVWELEIGGSVVSSPLHGKFVVEQDVVR